MEFEQNGEDRAKYGEKLIEEMSKMLKKKDVKGFSPIALRSYRAFYKIYPQIQQTVSVKLQNIESKSLSTKNIEIQQTMTVELDNELDIDC